MPLLDKNPFAALKKGRNSTSGYQMVRFIDAQRRTRHARVLGAGSTSGLKLSIEPGGRIVDNVPLATSRTSTNCYVSRL